MYFSFSEFFSIFSSVKIYLRNLILLWKYLYFSFFLWRSVSASNSWTLFINLLCSFLILLTINMLFRYINTSLLRSSYRTNIICLWKIAKASISLNGIIRYLNILKGILNAVFYSSLFLMQIWWNAFFRLIWEKYFALPVKLNKLCMYEMNVKFFWVTLFN